MFSADLASSCSHKQTAALAAVRSGLKDKPDLLRLASCGDFGNIKGNCERDMMRRSKADLDVKLRETLLNVPVLHKGTGKVRMSQAGVICPHDVLSVLEDEPKFPLIFGEQHVWVRFWHLVRDEDWFQEHPWRAMIESEPHLHAPVMLHSDDAPVSRRVGRNIKGLSMCGIFADTEATGTNSIIPLYVLPNDQAMAETIKERCDLAVVWSWEAMATNKHPSSAPEWLPLGRHRKKQAGKPISNKGIKLTYAAFTGDWSFHAVDFKLPCHYNTEEVCMQCPATKTGTLTNLTDCRPCAWWAANPRTLQFYLDHLIANRIEVPHLCKIPGWHTHSLMEDQLHGDALGVRQHGNASTLVRFCHQGKFGPYPTHRGSGTWQAKLDRCLHTASLEFQAFLRAERLTSSQPDFTHLSLSMHAPDDYPILKSKGKNNIVVTKFLLSVMRRSMDHSSEHDRQIFSLLWGLDGLWQLPQDIKPRWELSEFELERLEIYRQSALMSYYWLSVTSATEGKRLFNITPKYHQCDHMVRRTIRTTISYILWYCFRQEDHIGKVAKSCASTHGLTTMKRVVERWTIPFWVWLKSDE